MEIVTITELLRNPKGVIRKLERATDVLIERRDSAPLRLSLSTRLDEEREGTAVLARVLGRALPEMPELVERIWAPLAEAHPWLRFLPGKERRVFLQEFAETIESCASIGSNAPLSQLLHEWKATAEVYSDPALTAALKRPARGTRIRVPRPKIRH